MTSSAEIELKAFQNLSPTIVFAGIIPIGITLSTSLEFFLSISLVLSAGPPLVILAIHTRQFVCSALGATDLILLVPFVVCAIVAHRDAIRAGVLEAFHAGGGHLEPAGDIRLIVVVTIITHRSFAAMADGSRVVWVFDSITTPSTLGVHNSVAKMKIYQQSVTPLR